MTHILLLSYHPLLRGPAGATLPLSAAEELGDVQSLLDQLPNGSAEGCLWGLNEDGSPTVCLILEYAQEIATHFQEWAEDDPGSWFELQLSESEGMYALALVPDIKKSCDRQLAAMAITAGRAIPAPEEYAVLFRPLQFVSEGKSDTFLSLKNRISSEMAVGLLDPGDIPEQGVAGTDFGKVIELGSFKVTRGSYSDSALERRLKDG